MRAHAGVLSSWRALARRGALVAVLATPAAGAKPVDLALRRVDLDLPGPPAAIVPADLNRDGRADLVIVVAYTRWGAISRDHVEDAIAVTEVVPALFDVREARGFLARPDGTYAATAPLVLPASVLAVAPGSKGQAVLALTDDGVSRLDWTADAEPTVPGSPGTLALAPLLDEPSAFARSGAFLPDLEFARDVDADGLVDVLVPTPGGVAVHRGLADGGLVAAASFRGRLTSDETVDAGGAAVRFVPVPDVSDLDGDGTPDLVVSDFDASPQRVGIARGLGEGRFASPQTIDLGCLVPPPAPNQATAENDGPTRGAASRRVAWLGDLDGDARAEIVTREDVDTGKSDVQQAKKPVMTYRVHRLRADLGVETTPARTFEAVGYAFSGGFRDAVDLEFLDLDGDRRKDLVTITLDFSIFQALRALTAKKVSIGLEFHVAAQRPDGTFVPVGGQTLDEKLKLDLNRFQISRMGQFQGDFDGDGIVDFIHLGRGKTVTIHRGRAGGKYPDRPDLSISLDEEPDDLMLVRVADWNGDGRSDLAVTRPLPPPEPGASAPVRLELRLSGVDR